MLFLGKAGLFIQLCRYELAREVGYTAINQKHKAKTIFNMLIHAYILLDQLHPLLILSLRQKIKAYNNPL